MEELKITTPYRKLLAEVVTELREKLASNLYSCIIYGSAVRGGFVAGSSDLNLLLILNESTPSAHQAIARILKGRDKVKPFVIARIGMERSFAAFAIKFCSIGRHYRVLHGADPLADLAIDEKTLHFLTEQALRNLRLRSVHAYISWGHQRQRYIDYVSHLVPQIFTDIGTAFRVRGIELPQEFSDRIPILREHLGATTTVLGDMLLLKEKKTPLNDSEIFSLHSRLFALLDTTISWLAR